jgi:hypothetical protein
MTMIEKLVDWYPDESFLIADGFNDAIIGIDESSMRIIYSVTRCIEILCLDEEMDVEDAVEYFEFNVRGSYVGEKTPIWCEDNF